MLESWHMLRLALIVTALSVAMGAVGQASAEVARHPCVPKAAELRFKAADGTRLAGYRLGRGKTAVVLAHQTRADACQWGSYARRLAGRGYLVIAFDFRGYGDSQTRGFRAASRLSADVAAAARAARQRGAEKVFAVGASMGGTAVIAAGAHARPQLSGVISLSGPASFGVVSAINAAPKLTIPALYVAGQFDADYAADAQKLYDATASTDKAIHILPDGRHGVDFVRSDTRARSLLEAFIRSH
jgi:alpha-beta hydrolase superfamily lysophospholipase